MADKKSYTKQQHTPYLSRTFYTVVHPNVGSPLLSHSGLEFGENVDELVCKFSGNRLTTQKGKRVNQKCLHIKMVQQFSRRILIDLVFLLLWKFKVYEEDDDLSCGDYFMISQVNVRQDIAHPRWTQAMNRREQLKTKQPSQKCS